jgi:hypothetical protein
MITSFETGSTIRGASADKEEARAAREPEKRAQS